MQSSLLNRGAGAHIDVITEGLKFYAWYRRQTLLMNAEAQWHVLSANGLQLTMDHDKSLVSANRFGAICSDVLK